MWHQKIEKIISRDPTRSIIYITKYFQDKEDGLRQLHYRWSLIKNKDNIKDRTINKNMEKFFSNTPYYKGGLKELKEEDLVKTNFIGGKYASNNLSNMLTRLVDDYKILKKKKDQKGIIRYSLDEEFEAKFNVMILSRIFLDSKDSFDVASLYDGLNESSSYSSKAGLLKPIINQKICDAFYPNEPFLFRNIKIDGEISNYILFPAKDTEDYTEDVKKYFLENENLLNNKKTYFTVTYPFVHVLMNIKRDFINILTDEEKEKFSEYCKNLNEFAIFLNGLLSIKLKKFEPINIFWNALNVQIGIIEKQKDSKWAIQSISNYGEFSDISYFSSNEQ